MTRIGLVGLAEAGNLGDDLILVAAVQAAMHAVPDAEVSFTGYGDPLDWAAVGDALGAVPRLRRTPANRDLPFSRAYERELLDTDAVLFGGGGLLQTSHHPLRPYHWLRHLPSDGTPVLAVGLGLGPLSAAWSERLAAMGDPFDATWLRDDASVEFARTTLGWRADRCRDFVDGPFLRSIGVHGTASGDGPIGVAVREWPGLAPSDVARAVERLADERNAEEARFFVLESKGGNGPDVAFTETVRREVRGLSTRVEVYAGGDPVRFARSLAGCSAALSMKLHSSAVWGHAGVPLVPIVYAPKVAAFFGLDWHGLEIRSEFQAPAAEPASAPRSADVVAAELPRLLGGDAPGRATLPRRERLAWQTRSLGIDVTRKAARVAGRLRKGERDAAA